MPEPGMGGTERVVSQTIEMGGREITNKQWPLPGSHRDASRNWTGGSWSDSSLSLGKLLIFLFSCVASLYLCTQTLCRSPALALAYPFTGPLFQPLFQHLLAWCIQTPYFRTGKPLTDLLPQLQFNPFPISLFVTTGERPCHILSSCSTCDFNQTLPIFPAGNLGCCLPECSGWSRSKSSLDP